MNARLQTDSCSPTCYCRGLDLISCHSLWDWWWTKWQWVRFLTECFSFSLSVSFHQCCILRTILILFFSEWQASEVWESSNKAMLFQLLGSNGQQSTLTLVVLQRVKNIFPFPEKWALSIYLVESKKFHVLPHLFKFNKFVVHTLNRNQI